MVKRSVGDEDDGAQVASGPARPERLRRGKRPPRSRRSRRKATTANTAGIHQRTNKKMSW